MRMWMTVALLALFLTPAHAKDDDTRVAWLREHAVQVRSIDPADEDFTDLQPLKQILGEARIVQLGEQTHGDGACFLAKARLIRFLHQEMGFDVLAFESGLYDCAKGWTDLQADPKAVDKFDFGIFGIWTQSFEVKPTLDYLREAATTKRPLELCGYDCQLTSRRAQGLEADLRLVTPRVAPELLTGRYGQQLTTMLKHLLADKPAFSSGQAKDAIAWLTKLRAGLESGTGTLGARERAYWGQLTKSLSAQIENLRARSARRKPAPEDSNRRDGMMAENLIWLADQHYPKRKIIVWAATFHLMRNPARLRPLQGNLDYGKTVPMGHLVAKHFGKACYTLGFTAYQGRAGRPWTKSFALQRAPNGSFDALCHAAGLTNAIVDLRSPPEGGAWLQEPFVTRPLGNQPMRGPWHEVLDGLFFQRDMTPSTKTGYRPPEPASSSLLEELEKSWSNIESGLRSGNMWANKWTLEPPFESWLESERRSAAELEQQQQVAARFLEKHQGEPEAVWRAHALSAAIAEAAGQPQAALKALEAALQAFPDKEIPQASKTSQFQHLVNRKAFVLWEARKKPPIKWAMDVVARDKRLRYFYWPAWVERDAGVEAKLKKALKKAYKQRKKRFPQQAAEIDRALQEL